MNPRLDPSQVPLCSKCGTPKVVTWCESGQRRRVRCLPCTRAASFSVAKLKAKLRAGQ